MVDLSGRVAIVTGAGRGLGREHALLLARRGAKVIVNDLGSSVTGGGRSSEAAEDVADQIVRSGGEAIANTASVTDADRMNAMVKDAVERWGKVDILGLRAIREPASGQLCFGKNGNGRADAGTLA